MNSPWRNAQVVFYPTDFDIGIYAKNTTGLPPVISFKELDQGARAAMIANRFISRMVTR